jgi:hypothetical protein
LHRALSPVLRIGWKQSRALKDEACNSSQLFFYYSWSKDQEKPMTTELKRFTEAYATMTVAAYEPHILRWISLIGI